MEMAQRAKAAQPHLALLLLVLEYLVFFLRPIAAGVL